MNLNSITYRHISPDITFISIAEAARILGFKRSKIYYLTNEKSPYFDPTFPKKYTLGRRSARFIKSEIIAWAIPIEHKH